jgi:cyclophilin family peptidyl-prolyl cis-trans isomerase
MPTDKRERQRAGREARRAEARAAQKRAQRRRQIMSIVALLAVVIGIGLFISLSGGDDEGDGTDVATDTSTTTTSEVELGAAGDAQTCPPEGGVDEPVRQFENGPPKDCLAEGSTYSAVVETDVGTFTMALDREKAPMTVNNFVFLARYGAYTDVPFHRVIPDFVVQGGDVALQNGTGDAGYKIAEEVPEAGEYEIGSVAMAKGQGPTTSGSQFFIVTGPNGVALPPEYTLFGKVTEGLDVVKQIEADGSASGTPTTVHKIVNVTINETKG